MLRNACRVTFFASKKSNPTYNLSQATDPMFIAANVKHQCNRAQQPLWLALFLLTLFYYRASLKIEAQFMKRIKQHFFHPKTRQIAHYSPHFWIKNALFTTFPKSHFNY